MKIRISSVDKLFSLLIRTRDKWTCQRCFTKYEPPTMGLHCAHIFGRGLKNTRFDFENAVAWCYGCHSYMDSHPLDKYEWHRKRIGTRRFDALRLRSNNLKRPDYDLIEIGLKARLKELKENEDREIIGKH